MGWPSLLSGGEGSSHRGAWESTAVAAPGVLSDGTSGRRREERMRSRGVGDGGREGRYKAQNAEVAARRLTGSRRRP